MLKRRHPHVSSNCAHLHQQAYGDEGSGEKVPAGATLTFEIELLDFTSAEKKQVEKSKKKKRRKKKKAKAAKDKEEV